MKICREPAVFSPISIILEKQKEADLFLSIIKKLDARHCNANPPPKITGDEYKIIRHISDAFTKNGSIS